MATASSEGEGGCTESENMIGTLGDLPDPVVHHIVSFLAIADLTRFGCASKKCRELYLSSPSLKFDEFSLANTSSCYKRMKLFRSLDKFLIRRPENKLHQFCIRWVPPEYYHERPCFCGCNEKPRIMAWIHYAVRCNVEVLDLQISIFKNEAPLAFPCCIFLCESLRSLSVDMNCKIQTPSFTFFSNLTYLELTNVEIEEESFFKWISQSCKCIEVLNLEDVYGIKNINIESSSLESLYFEYTFNQTSICHLNISGEKLDSITIIWVFDSPSNKSFNVSAPNLKSFYWVGNLMSHSYMKELVGLEEVGFYLEPEEDENDHVLDDILGTSHKRSFLVIKEDALKVLYRRGISPTSFGNICYLRMHIGSFVSDLVPSMVFLFGAMTNLSTLYIKSTPPLYDFGSNTSGFNMGYWEQQNLGFIYNLKEVTIELSNGSNGMELARYILEHAQCLEKMLVVYLPHQCDIVKRMLDGSKMISSGIVVFKENRCKRKLV